MSRDTGEEHISKREVVYTLPGTGAVKVRRDVGYVAADGGPLTMDIYQPPGAGAPTPAVVIVAGFPDPGFEARVGCKFKEMGSSVSWARLLAASGLSAVTYANREPEADLHALLGHVRRHSAGLGIDAGRLGLWASSGHVTLALSALMREPEEHLKCAALCYGYTLDPAGACGVAEAAARWGFANPCAGRSVADLPPRTPLFVARAGRDQMPGLNDALDHFLSAALARNLPLTLSNHPDGPHAFDLFHDSEASREIIRQILTFLRSHLRPAARGGRDG